MGDKNVKLLRKQVRNVVKELFPQILNNELVEAVHKKLAENINGRLTAMGNKIEKELEEINTRSKDVQAYVVSRIGTPTAPPIPSGPLPAEPAIESPKASPTE
jgi:hypothetical protein